MSDRPRGLSDAGDSHSAGGANGSQLRTAGGGVTAPEAIHRVLIPRQPSAADPPTQWSPSGEPGCEGVSFAEQHGSGFAATRRLASACWTQSEQEWAAEVFPAAWSRRRAVCQPFGEGDSAGTGFFEAGGRSA